MKSLKNYIQEIKVAYVHGFRGSAKGRSYNIFKENMPKGCSLYSIEYDENNPEQAISTIKSFVKTHKIDLLIGVSYGAWLCMMIQNVKRIIANPCFHPHIELPKWPTENDDEKVKPDVCEKIKQVDEKEFAKSNSKKSKENLFCFFGTKDEFLGEKYTQEFRKNWFINDNMDYLNTEHSVNDESLKKLCNFIPKFMNT